MNILNEAEYPSNKSAILLLPWPQNMRILDASFYNTAITMTTIQKSIFALGVAVSTAIATAIRFLTSDKSHENRRQGEQLDTALAAVRRGETLPFDVAEWRSKAEAAADRDAASENSLVSSR